MQGRRRAREYVLKILYAQQLTGDPIESVAEHLFEREELPAKLHDFARTLAIKTYANAETFDTLVQGKSEHWDFDRIALIDKLILRIALCEMLHFEDIPPKVSISEAIEIAKEYSTENSGSFVNGILDAIFTDLREEGQIFTD